ncbi:hyaluronoglucosaminidase, putative [Babesia ovata]|uniref:MULTISPECIES: hyaluronoglucosaminidase, putative n=1 Tax=Babesia ovata TaxID=189622 RepID=A0A2H6KCP2_9APIC|nr:hyaluronoglucosaminidase, putative [Babesia ovata]GBE60755.1 hyaluronoglucosaminidase, putative [Babesia ovata]
MPARAAELGALRESGAASSATPSKPRDRVAAFQELAKAKRGLPRHLVAEIERRKVTTVEEAAHVAHVLRTKRTKSHKIAKPRKPLKKSKAPKSPKPAELTRPSGKAARKVISRMTKALNTGVVKL